MPPSQALLPFIANAVDDKGDHPLENVRETAAVNYEFWPYLSESDCHPCEPDVLLRISEHQGREFIVLIEAKYLSGKSSERDERERPNDQLAREHDNLRLVADKEKRIPILIYLTAGLGFPEDEIEASKSELHHDRNITVDFYWLSWRHLFPVIENAEEPVLKHLAQLMRKISLLFFNRRSLFLLDIKLFFFCVILWSVCVWCVDI